MFTEATSLASANSAPSAPSALSPSLSSSPSAPSLHNRSPSIHLSITPLCFPSSSSIKKDPPPRPKRPEGLTPATRVPLPHILLSLPFHSKLIKKISSRTQARLQKWQVIAFSYEAITAK